MRPLFFKSIIISVLVLAVHHIYAQSVSTYQYDELNRLTSVAYDNGITVTYTYDALGNRTSNKVTGSAATTYTISVAVTPKGSGNVTGGGTYNKGTIVKLNAVANDGYEFSKWNDGVTTNPRTVTVNKDMSFTAHFVEGSTPPVDRIILDETSTTYPAAAKGVDVQVNRTIKAGTWNTICLPFAMTSEQAKAAFGNRVELADFAGYKIAKKGNDIVAILVKFTPLDITDGIKANHPYLIKTSSKSDITMFTANNVNINPDEKPVVATMERTDKEWSEFIGTYVTTEMPTRTLYFSDDKFNYALKNKQINAFHAYFDFSDMLSGLYLNNVSFVIEESTGITDIEIEDMEPEGWYTTDGRKLNGKPDQKGIYIVNGKKVLVK